MDFTACPPSEPTEQSGLWTRGGVPLTRARQNWLTDTASRHIKAPARALGSQLGSLMDFSVGPDWETCPLRDWIGIIVPIPAHILFSAKIRRVCILVYSNHFLPEYSPV